MKRLIFFFLIAFAIINLKDVINRPPKEPTSPTGIKVARK